MSYPKLLIILLATSLFFSCNDLENKQQQVKQTVSNTSNKPIIENTINSSPKKNNLTSIKAYRNSSKTKIDGKDNALQKESGTFYSIFEPIKEPTQQFTIPTSGKTITCRKGTKINFPKAAFINATSNTTIEEEVSITVREFYTRKDFIANNLSTMSENQLLESGGTIHIEAQTLNGTKCILAPHTSIEIEFPFSKAKDDMQIFYGDKTETGMNWQLAKEDESTIFNTIEQMAEFVGGDSALTDFISNTTNYPRVARQQGIFGVVYVEFTIDKTGKVSKASVLKSPHQALSDEAIRVVKLMPDFYPARNNDQPVPCVYTLPINFIIEGFDSSRPTINNSSFGLASKQSSKSIEEKVATAKKLEELDSYTVNAYILTSAKLGWINCDRFYKDKKQKINLAIKKSQYLDEQISIIFKNFNAVMPGRSLGDSMLFKKIPIDEEITIFALKKKDSQYYLATTQTNTTSLNSLYLDYKPINKNQLKDAIAKLDTN